MIFEKLLAVTRCKQLQSVRHASWFKNVFKVERNHPPFSHCIQIGDPRLRKKSDPIPPELIPSPEIQFLISQMKRVQEAYSLVGLASPQIGIELRVFVMSFGEHLKEKFKPEIYKAKEMSTFPFTVFINPEITILDHKKVIFEESCASVVGFAAEIARNYSVQVDALDAKGKPISHIFTGWNARIAQHENDHLDGILFTDIMDRKTLRCTNWEAVNAKGGRIEVPYYPK